MASAEDLRSWFEELLDWRTQGSEEREADFYISFSRAQRLKERKTLYGTVNPKFEVRGKTRYLRGRPNIKRRMFMAFTYGYGPNDSEVVGYSDFNLNSSSHWRKGKIVRWNLVYKYCKQVGLDFRDPWDWAEATDQVDGDRDNNDIWGILADTDPAGR